MPDSNIVTWRDYIPEATIACTAQFGVILESYDLTDIDAEDILQRIMSRYVGYIKLIHHKVKKYFVNIQGLHGVAPQFAKKDAKWLFELLRKRTKNKEVLTTEVLEDLLLWSAQRYNFWLAQQF